MKTSRYGGIADQGKVRELYGWPVKLGKDLKSVGRFREFEN